MPEANRASRDWGSWPSRIRDLILHPAMRQRVLAPLGFDASILVMNAITGIAVARALGPSGRGELAAILLFTQMAGWLLSMGSTEAISYQLARHPADSAKLLGSWLAVSLPLTIFAIVIGELVLPILFAAQTSEAIDLARIYLLAVGLIIAQGFLNGMLLGNHDFLPYNISRLAPPLLIAIGYLALWATGNLSVELALITNALASGAGVLVAGLRSWRSHGIAAPHMPLLKGTLWFGLKAHGGSIAGFVNARLDLLIIPAFLSAASVGLYSVATNVTSIIATLTSTVALIALPVAARRATRSARTVVRTLHAVLLIGVTIAIPLAILAEIALTTVYGAKFGDAATALRLLLPGALFDAAATVLWAGLLAANRPFLSTVGTAPAAILTVIGLLLFLDQGGIEAAAIVTTTAYTVVFVIFAVLYRRVAGLRWRDFLRAPPSEPLPDLAG